MRRSRYTVETNAGPKVVLAYSHGGAIEFYEKRGYRVIEAYQGDYRIQARNATIKARGGFTINRAALNEAKRQLGLKIPVRIRFNDRVGNTGGNYRREDTYHNIMIKRYLTPEQASESIWHELIHAKQSEAAGSREDWLKVLKVQKKLPYRQRPIEIEAYREQVIRHRQLPLAY